MACAESQLSLGLLAGLISAAVAALVGHGALRPLLEARGVAPWRWSDSLGAIPLVLLGSAAFGAGIATLVTALLGWPIRACGGIITRAADVSSDAVAAPVERLLSVAVAGIVLGVGVVTLRLGLLALRKLSA